MSTPPSIDDWASSIAWTPMEPSSPLEQAPEGWLGDPEWPSLFLGTKMNEVYLYCELVVDEFENLAIELLSALPDISMSQETAGDSVGKPQWTQYGWRCKETVCIVSRTGELTWKFVRKCWLLRVTAPGTPTRCWLWANQESLGIEHPSGKKTAFATRLIGGTNKAGHRV